MLSHTTPGTPFSSFPHLNTQHVLCFISPLCLLSPGQQASCVRKEDERRGTSPPHIFPNVLSCWGLFTNKSVRVHTLKKKMGPSIRLQTKIAWKVWSHSCQGHCSVLNPCHDQQPYTYNWDAGDNKKFLLRGRHLRKNKIRLSNSTVILQGDVTNWQHTEIKRHSQAGHSSGVAGRGL